MLTAKSMWWCRVQKANLRKRIAALAVAVELLRAAPVVEAAANAETDVLIRLRQVYKQLTSLIRKRYCRSASGNALSAEEVQLEGTLKREADDLLASIGYPDGAAGQASAEANRRLEQFRLRTLRPEIYGGPLTPAELEEQARLKQRRQILEAESPVEQARSRLEQFKYRQLGFLLPMSGSELDEALRIEAILDTYPLRGPDEDTSRWLSDSGVYLASDLPQPIRAIQESQIDEFLSRYDVNRSISVLIADEAVGADDIGQALRGCGIADFVWASSLNDAIDRLSLFAYDLLIVSLDNDWGVDLTKLAKKQFKQTAVLSMTTDEERGENWSGRCLLRRAMTRSLASNLRSLGLTNSGQGLQWPQSGAALGVDDGQRC
jgi:hypothetical protein